MNLTEKNQSDRCLYFSCPERSGSPALYMLLYVSAAAVVLLTVCGNLLVIISVFHFKQLHTPTNMLVLSLAVSDFLVGAFLMPPHLSWMIESCWIFGTDFCISFLSTSYFLTSLSIYHIVLIAVDRYSALSNPFLYTNTMSVSTMCTVIFIDWCVWLLYNLLLEYFNGNFTTFVICPGECFFILNEVLSLVDLLLAFIFPFTVIIVLYTGVFVIAKKHVTAIREINNLTRSQTHTDSTRSEGKAAKALSILVSVFLACLLPYCIYCSLGGVVTIDLESFQKVLMVLYLNSTINPGIYALFYPWFRRCIKIIISLQIFQTDSSLINVLS